MAIVAKELLIFVCLVGTLVALSKPNSGVVAAAASVRTGVNRQGNSWTSYGNGA